jgi:hypothetical protein
MSLAMWFLLQSSIIFAVCASNALANSNGETIEYAKQNRGWSVRGKRLDYRSNRHQAGGHDGSNQLRGMPTIHQ